jgi:hypothetical protein
MTGVIIAAIVGLALVLLGLRMEGHAYLPGLLLEFGASLILVAPLLLLGRALERRIRATETATRSLADAVAKVQERTSETVFRLDELGAATREGLQRERTDAAASLRAVELAPSYERVVDSLQRAYRLRSIPAGGVRVRLPASTLRLRFEPGAGARDRDADGLYVTVEEVDGSPRAQVSWRPGETADELMRRLGLELRRIDSYPGDQLFDATKILASLVRDLEVALDATTTGPRGVGPVIEVLNDQWVLSTEGLECLERPYRIPTGRLLHSREGWAQYMLKQYWVDQDQFLDGYRIALAWHRRSRAVG